MNYAETVAVFTAFCDENRLRILEILAEGEQSATELLGQMDIVQSTLSHHMKLLCDSHTVSARRDGKRTLYSIDADGFDHAAALLKQISASAAKSRRAQAEKGWERIVSFID